MRRPVTGSPNPILPSVDAQGCIWCVGRLINWVAVWEKFRVSLIRCDVCAFDFKSTISRILRPTLESEPILHRTALLTIAIHYAVGNVFEEFPRTGAANASGRTSTIDDNKSMILYHHACRASDEPRWEILGYET